MKEKLEKERIRRDILGQRNSEQERRMEEMRLQIVELASKVAKRSQ